MSKIAAGLVSILILGLSSQAHAQAPESISTQVSDLQAVLERHVDSGVPGVSAALATSRGVIWTGTAGLASIQDQIPIDEAHVFGIGSITKTFLALVVLQLMEEGKLTPDTHAGDVLGDMLDGIPNAREATIAQLLSHTSGVPSWEDDPVWIREGRGSAIALERLWTKTAPLDYVRGPHSKAVNVPGRAYSYSNSNHTILGLIVEALTGRDAQLEIRRRVIDPLELGSMYLEGFETGDTANLPRRYHYATSAFANVAGIASAFTRVRPGLIDVTPSNLSVEWTAGGMVGSSYDLARFGLALRDAELISPDSKAFMKDWRSTGSDFGSAVGHGLFRQEVGPHRLIGHSGNVLGFSSALYWLEDKDIVIAVSVNVGSMHSGADVTSASDIVKDRELLDLLLEVANKAKTQH